MANTSVGYLYLVAGGHRRASAELAKRIEQASSAKVTRHDLRPDIFDPPEDAAPSTDGGDVPPGREARAG